MIGLFLVFVFILGTIWDTRTTFLGMVVILGGQNVTSIVQGMSFVGALMILGLNFNTLKIWQGFRGKPSSKSEVDVLVVWVLRVFWIAAIIIDFFTSFTINYGYISRNREPAGVDFFAGFIVVFVTALATISPMFVGRFWREQRKKMKAKEKERQERRQALRDSHKT